MGRFLLAPTRSFEPLTLTSYFVDEQLLETSVASEKMHKLDEHIGVAVAGINSDANILINSARLSAQRYAMSYAERSTGATCPNLCDQKQGYRQYVALRPFGVSFLFAGWCVCSARLYLLPISDDRLRPSNSLTGTRVLGFSCTKVILGKLRWLDCQLLGANSQAAQAILKTEYTNGMTIAAARRLAMKVLKQTMDSTLLQPEKVECAKSLCLRIGKLVSLTGFLMKVSLLSYVSKRMNARAERELRSALVIHFHYAWDMMV